MVVGYGTSTHRTESTRRAEESSHKVHDLVEIFFGTFHIFSLVHVSFLSLSFTQFLVK
jgi:hypothetical protein